MTTSNKFRVAFDVDMSHIAPDIMGDGKSPEAQIEDVRDAMVKMLLGEARFKARAELHGLRKDQTLDPDVKAIRMGEQLRKMMLTLMAEANLKVEALAQDAEVSTLMPFEERYQRAA